MRNEEAMCEGLLSVVIPVYNIRDYVERCVRSVLAQPDVPLEVLIVDDGSTDDSGAVCDALAAEDSRVTVIHKPNGGLSDARNYGLCHAQGEYILFMDGDDWLTENVCPGLLQMALQDRADVVIGKAHFLREEPVMTRWEEAVEKNFTFHTVYTGKEYLLKCLQTGGLTGGSGAAPVPYRFFADKRPAVLQGHPARGRGVHAAGAAAGAAGGADRAGDLLLR